MPDAIVLKRDRDLEGRQNDIWVRMALLALVAAIPVVALFNVFGQRPDTHTLVGPAVSLKIYAPPGCGPAFSTRRASTSRRGRS